MTLLAITRAVSPAVAHCELTHLARVPIDLERARREHEQYEAALAGSGCTVLQLPSDETMPDAVFIEDTAVVLDEIAVITRPGAASRMAETAVVAAALQPLRPLAEIEPPATLDGGDVLRLGRRLFVGVGSRTNQAGLEQLRTAAAPHGYSVLGVTFRGCLHLKSAVTAVGDDRILLNPAWVDAAPFGASAILVDPAEPHAGNALDVDGTIIYPLEYSRTRAILEKAHFEVRSVPAGELAKAEGGVTCGCLLVRT